MIAYSFTKYADRQLQKLPIPTQRFIVKKIEFYIATGNPLHYADSVEGERGKVCRFRIGDYRVIFDWTNGGILILKVASRAKAY
jgi:mRNA-degrading endonuclease RelE of RelBE toxin-antitoxin system